MIVLKELGLDISELDMAAEEVVLPGVYRNGAGGELFVLVFQTRFVAFLLKRTDPEDKVVYIGQTSDLIACLESGDVERVYP